MFTGWFPKYHYPLNRPLTEEENKEQLKPYANENIPYHWLQLLRANGTFIECAERSQNMRGSFIVLFLAVAVAFLCGWIGYILIFDFWAEGISALRSPEDAVNWGSLIVFSLILLAMLIAVLRLFLPILRYNTFSYTHFPRCFNRKNRQVYIFNRDSSVTKLPFDEVFWHIGHGVFDKDLIDLRGHQLDQDGNVIFTFSASLSQDQATQRHMILDWFEYICTYMEKGPAGIAENDWDRMISVKFNANWKGSYAYVASRYQQLYKLFFWFVPIHASFYWLSMKLSKEPKWPQWVEDECAIDPNDPPPWPEPEYSGQFDGRTKDDAYYDQLAKRMKLVSDTPLIQNLRRLNRMAIEKRHRNRKK